MKTRCHNSKHDYYRNYGGKGVKVCPEWEHSFIAFRKWAMGITALLVERR